MKSFLTNYWTNLVNSNAKSKAKKIRNKKNHINLNLARREKLASQKQLELQSNVWLQFKNLALKNLIGSHMKMPAQLFFNSNKFVYSFNKSNNLFPLLTKVESLLKNFFLSIYCLISKPIYLITHDKVIIRLFVYLSPKISTFINSGLSLPLKNKDKPEGRGLLNLFKVNNRNKDTSILLDPKAQINLKLSSITSVFEKIFNKKVQLELIKLQHPFHNSKILAQVLGLNVSKYRFKRLIKILIPRAVIVNPTDKQVNYFELREEERKARRFKQSITTSYLNNPYFNYNNASFNKIISQLLSTASIKLPLNSNNDALKNKSIFNSYLSGINVKLGGRLVTEPLRPRFSVQNNQQGSLARVKVQVIERSRYTGKNKRGSYSITVTMSHVLNS